MLTGFAGSRMSKTQVYLTWSAQLSAIPSSATTSRSRVGSGSAVWVPPPNGGDQLRWTSSLGGSRVRHVVDGQAAVTPGAVGQAVGDDGVVQPVAALCWPCRLLTPGQPHARQPPGAGDARPSRVCQVDGDQHIVAEPAQQRGGIGPA